MNLFLALLAEHRQRTGHDIYKMARGDTRAFTCEVCLHLGAEKRDQEKAEAAFYDEQEKLAKGDRVKG